LAKSLIHMCIKDPALVFGARDAEHNDAVVPKSFLEDRLFQSALRVDLVGQMTSGEEDTK